MKALILALPLMASLMAWLKDETVSGISQGDLWVLQEIDGAPVSVRVTLSFPEEGQVQGEAPCNSYFADQRAPLPWFEAGPIAATKRACPELELEAQYLSALQAVNLAEITGDVMLLSEGERLRLRFLKDP